MNYQVINKDGYTLYSSDSLSDVTAYVLEHQHGSEDDPSYPYAVIDYTDRANYVEIYLQLDVTLDADIISKLNSESNPQAYIKELIRADIPEPDPQSESDSESEISSEVGE